MNYFQAVSKSNNASLIVILCQKKYSNKPRALEHSDEN